MPYPISTYRALLAFRQNGPSYDHLDNASAETASALPHARKIYVLSEDMAEDETFCVHHKFSGSKSFDLGVITEFPAGLSLMLTAMTSRIVNGNEMCYLGFF